MRLLVDRPQVVVVETEIPGHGGTDTLHHHVGAGHQPPELEAALVGAEVDHHRAAAPVPAAAALEGADPAAPRAFHLDDVGSVFGQEKDTEGTGDPGA